MLRRLLLIPVLFMALINWASAQSIGDFPSVLPGPQSEAFVLPPTHRFQYLIGRDDPLTNGGFLMGKNDFTAYIPDGGTNRSGHLCINHEDAPGGVSVHDIHFNEVENLWEITRNEQVDFNGVVRTHKNCSGGISQWGTLLSAEEYPDDLDQNQDGRLDVGWIIEIDPENATIVDHDGDGQPQKLWEMGRFSHENVVVADDRKTVYLGQDDQFGYVYKFVADEAEDLTTGTLYTLKMQNSSVNDHTGYWIPVPNKTLYQQNNTRHLADSLGATAFLGVEDAEIGPSGDVFFTSKVSGRVYRFTEAGDSVVNFNVYVENISYEVMTPQGIKDAPWGVGADNLAFDNAGNLWVLQDGDENHIWMVKAGHTMNDPKVSLFARTPAGCEPTGITFSPDCRYMFLSLMHPGANNTFAQRDAAGRDVVFDRCVTVAIALKEHLGGPTTSGLPFEILTYPANPSQEEIVFEISSTGSQEIDIEVTDATGRKVYTNAITTWPGSNQIGIPDSGTWASGTYLISLKNSFQRQTLRVVRP